MTIFATSAQTNPRNGDAFQPHAAPARGRERSLAWHLTLLCFALVLPIITLGGILVWSYAGAERGRLEQAALRTALQTTAAIDHELAGLVATTQILALSPRLQSGDLEGFDKGAREVSRILGTNVVVRDRESHQVVNTRLPQGAPLPMNVETESDQIALQTRKPVVSNLFKGGVTHKLLFMVNVPVLRGDEVVYFVNLSLEPERVRDVILGEQLRKGWSAIVTDRQGAVVRMTATQRGALLRRLGDLIAQHADVLAQTEVRDNGKLIAEMEAQLRYIPQWYYYHGGLADKVEGGVIPTDKAGVFNFTRWEPSGVVVAIVHRTLDFRVTE